MIIWIQYGRGVTVFDKFGGGFDIIFLLYGIIYVS